MILQPTLLTRFIATAREREAIRLRRLWGQTRPWTDDLVLANHRFSNVFREHDKTTVVVLRILKSYARRLRPAVALCLRMINRHDTLEQWTPAAPVMEQIWLALSRQINTTAYRINTPLGLNNRDGIKLLCDQIGRASESLWRPELDLRAWCALVAQETQVTPFLQYQAALDLRHLGELQEDDPPWAYASVGAVRGLLRLTGQYVEDPNGWNGALFKNWGNKMPQSWVMEGMEQLVEPARRLVDARWSVHESEWWLCSFDKYERLRDRHIAAGHEISS